MKVWERVAEIKGIFYGHCQSIILTVPAIKPNESKKLRDSGSIRIEGVKFINNSALNFFECLRIGKIEKYSYEYIQPNGFFFDYEIDGKENGIRKPLHHLHVGIKKNADKDLLERLPEVLIEHKGPHYKAPEMDFNEFMGIIVANFFDDEANCDKMLENLGV